MKINIILFLFFIFLAAIGIVIGINQLYGIYFGKIVPKIGGWLSDPAAYRYLPKSVAYLPPRDEMLRVLQEAGFSDATHHQLSGGITQLMLGTRDQWSVIATTIEFDSSVEGVYALAIEGKVPSRNDLSPLDSHKVTEIFPEITFESFEQGTRINMGN